MTGRLQGRVALVTGAGNGIGRATALRLAAEGAIVGVNDLRSEFTRRTILDIEAAGGQAIDLPMSMAERPNVRQAVQTLVDRTGRFDIMVNNAAWVRYEAIEAIEERTVDRMVGIGFNGVIWGIQAAADAMKEGGVIVNVASSAGYLGIKHALIYCGIKAGVIGLTRSAATELGERGIRVNAVAPGSTKTEGVASKLTPEKLATRLVRVPLGRLGEVEDIANTIFFLSSDEASYITGEVITIDGGITRAFF